MIRHEVPARRQRKHGGDKTKRSEAGATINSFSFDLARLRAEVKPFRLHWFSRLKSTNNHAALLRRRGELFAPAIILTGNQTAGRGRGENTWWSGRGSLTVTFVLPTDEQVLPHQIPLLAGLAVRNAIAEITGENGIQLKWPNDLIHGGRKIGGLLCERIQKADLVGLGLNVNVEIRDVPRTLQKQISTLQSVAGKPLDLTATLSRVADHLHAMVSRPADHPFPSILREYDSYNVLIGRRVSIIDGEMNAPSVGRCEGLDSMGRLLLRTRSSLQHVISGQVQVM